MKTVSSALGTHLEGEVTSLCTLWRITRTDGQEFFFTDLDQDVTYGGNTYVSSAGYTRSAVDNQIGLAVDNLETVGFLETGSLEEGELRAGLFDYAEVRIYVVNHKDLSQLDLKMRRGKLGEVTYSEKTGTFKAELRGLTQLYSQRPVELYQAECRADLGDSRCKVPIAPSVVLPSTSYSLGDFVRGSPDLDGVIAPAHSAVIAALITEDYEDVYYEVTTAGTTDNTYPNFDPTPGNTTNWNGVVFTAVEAWTRAVVVATVTDNRTFTVTFPNGADSRDVDDWFKYGAVTWDTGDNAGLSMEVKSWDSTGAELELFLEMPFAIQVGDKLGVYAGCDKRRQTCRDKFDNIVNRRAEDYVPGQDEFLNYPDAKG